MTLLGVALRRMRCQRADPLALFAAVLAGCALLAAVSIVGALGREDATRAGLEAMSAPERSVRAQVTFDPAIDRDDVVEARAAAGMARLREVTDGLTRVRVWGPIEPSDERGTRLVTVSGAGAARPCRGSPCEVRALGPQPKVGSALTLQGVRLRVVGRTSLPAGVRPSSAVLRGKAIFVPDDPRFAALESGERRFTVLSAPLDAGAIRGSRLGDTADLIERTLTRVHQDVQPSRVAGPVAQLRRLDRRITTSQRRLLVIGIDGAALLIAFAAFFASTRRDEVAHGIAQLSGLGASRRQLALLRLVETAVPTAAALAVALVGGVVAAALYANDRDLGSAFVGSALPVVTIAAMAGLAALASAVVLAWGRRPAAAASRTGALEAGACVALAVIVWQAATTGGLDPDTLADDGGAVPVMLFVPALAVLAFGVVLLRVLPLGFRLVERALRRASPVVRLGLLGTVRHPRLAAAATTFLAVALGSALFALNYRSTLVADAHAGARFRAGAAWRVGEHPSVAPLTRYRRVTGEAPMPVLRLQAALDTTGETSDADIELLGIPAQGLAQIRGWRASFSESTPAQLGRAIAKDRARFSGPRLAPTATAIRLWARTPTPRDVNVRLLTAGQRFDELPLGGTDDTWHHLRARVPARARGAMLASVELGGDPFGAARSADFGVLQQRLGDGRWVRLADLLDWRGPVGGTGALILPAAHGVTVTFDPFGHALIRPPYDVPQALPAIAGPAVGRGRVDLRVAGFRMPVEVIGHSSLFPSVTNRPHRFVVVDYDTLFAYLNGGLPGFAEPSEAWFFSDPPRGLAAALARPPFRAAALTELRALDRAAANDVLALNARDLLTVLAAVAALLGVAGFLVAIRAIARDERQELAEYEAQGVAPAQLGAALRIRLAAMASVGLVAAVAGGIAGNALTAGLVAVSGAGREPLPPIEARVAWVAGAALLLAVAIAVAAVTRSGARPSAVPVARRLREG